MLVRLSRSRFIQFIVCVRERCEVTLVFYCESCLYLRRSAESGVESRKGRRDRRRNAPLACRPSSPPLPDFSALTYTRSEGPPLAPFYRSLRRRRGAWPVDQHESPRYPQSPGEFVCLPACLACFFGFAFGLHVCLLVIRFRDVFFPPLSVYRPSSSKFPSTARAASKKSRRLFKRLMVSCWELEQSFKKRKLLVFLFVSVL
jgi:hypothetical protein